MRIATRIATRILSTRALSTIDAATVQLGSRGRSMRDPGALREQLHQVRRGIGFGSSFHTCSHNGRQNEQARNDLAYCLSFASGESDFERNFQQLFPTEQMKEQLTNSHNQLKLQNPLDTEPLPRTLQDAVRPTSRAIVITDAKAPFAVWDVNDAWEGLCGYSYVEAKGQKLGDLLKGPETDASAATALIAALLRGEEAGTTLVNYTKEGRRFVNRLRVGPLQESADGPVTHFVGVLQEI